MAREKAELVGARPRVGVVDDDPDFLALSCELVRHAGGDPVAFRGAREAMDAIDAGVLDAVLTDLRLPDELDGEAIVRRCRTGPRHLRVAVVSRVDSAELGLRLARLGADDYVVKPVDAPDLGRRIAAFLAGVRLDREVDALRAATGDAVASQTLSASRALGPLLEMLPRAARSGATILVLGESGTGKELAARAVHELSRRAGGPFVAVDCGAIPDALLENELFGHRRGAFSDAREDADGLVQRADGGTLFLDEVGELPLPMQAKLLRFMQTREFRRLGDPASRVADVRVVAATNRDLRAAVREGSFREDLYFRLAVIELHIPALRERRQDIPVLAASFLRRYGAELESPALTFSAAALEHLKSRPWPGNIRELENVVQRAAALARRPVLGPEDLAGASSDDALRSVREPPAEELVDDTAELLPFHDAKQKAIRQFERDYARRLLRRHGGSLVAAARAAGLDRKSLARLLVRHGTDVRSLLAEGTAADADLDEA